MIIFKDLSYQKHSQYPDINYLSYKYSYDENEITIVPLEESLEDTDNPVAYVINDDSPFATIVEQYAPNISIETDDNGEIINVKPWYSLEQIKKTKCSEINQACNTAIVNGIDYNGEHFDLTEEDQINILSGVRLAEQGKPVPYHSSGNPFRLFCADEFLDLAYTVDNFKNAHLTYCNLLKQQVNEMETSDEVNAVVYGIELNEKYKAIYDTVVGTE